jgi:hypothetical protein
MRGVPRLRWCLALTTCWHALRLESPIVNVLFVTSEAVPFAKTGGLADVSGSLPAELLRLGHHAVLMLPANRQLH